MRDSQNIIRIDATLALMEKHFSVQFSDLIDFDTFVRFGAVAGGEIEFVRMERADDLARAADAFGQGALSMGTSVLCGKKAAIPLAEDSDFLAFHNIASALAERDFVNTAQINHCCVHH